MGHGGSQDNCCYDVDLIRCSGSLLRAWRLCGCGSRGICPKRCERSCVTGPAAGEGHAKRRWPWRHPCRGRQSVRGAWRRGAGRGWSGGYWGVPCALSALVPSEGAAQGCSSGCLTSTSSRPSTSSSPSRSATVYVMYGHEEPVAKHP